jgi:tRNA G46 methylase TrmB
LDLTGDGVVIDIGTGDGRFVYQSARQNPKKFYIGIDPNVRPLEKISEKIYRKPSKAAQLTFCSFRRRLKIFRRS